MAMDTRFEPNHSSEAMHLHEAEECIIQQQKLAEGLEALGHRRQARQARAMLATFVKSYLATQDCREKMDFQSFSALTKTWLKLTVDDQQAFLDALSKVPKSKFLLKQATPSAPNVAVGELNEHRILSGNSENQVERFTEDGRS